MKIAMIEDDTELAELLCAFLAQYNLHVTNYEDPYLGISALAITPYDLLILDLSLPGMDGLEICREVRQKSDIPIIISSARSDLDDKVIGLSLGADDYLPKPYAPKELYARILSVARRYKKGVQDTPAPASVFTLDEKAGLIYFRQTPLKLTRAEFEVLGALVHQHGCVVSREQLIGAAPSLGEESESRSLDVLISRIRAKLGENSKEPKHLHSVRGIGYRLAG
ncbi:response regulator transcription factor [Sulfurospirillum sp. T05]|uniref:Response regulator transcription factor n=1 Tax=Sulfurospirillum tamanense TaxID=2813362 RepID=A0ABS2WTI9_9BACT|nr:response regulator transcription factor [Sulfurospirillum tamanensis]MBN2964956.1 response regulator transcription factor [Sulfurospirillum tamanensis]